MLNIVIPMAGAGSRFAKVGFRNPKPLIKIHGVCMIRLVIENLRPARPHRFIFVVQRSHAKDYPLKEILDAWAPGSAMVELDGLTEGAACSVLAARELINTNMPLMIANSDQYVGCNINDYLATLDTNGLDGLIMTMSADDPKWSYVGMGESAFVERVVEKEVISNEATVGIYNFRRGADFVNAADKMIETNQRSKGEFYVAPTYNQLIALDQKVGIFNIGSEAKGMYGLGTPEDLQLFLDLPLSTLATKDLK